MDSEIHQVSSSNQISEGESLTARSNEDVVAPSSSVRRKSMKPRSDVWGHFDKIVDVDGKLKGKCKYCGKLFFCDSKKNGTSAFRGHIKNCKDHPHRTETRLAFSSQIGSENLGSPSITWTFDELSIRKALSVMIIHDELPFKFVEGTGFKYFMAVACPRFQIPSRWTIQRDCFQLYLDEKLKLKKFLKESCERVCLTTDTWTSIQKINYMCLTAHWIGCDWKLNKRILNFCPVSSHRGDDLARAVERCLLDWGIDKVFTITVDNASANDVMVNQLKKRFTNWGSDVLKGKFLHVRCVAHITNLIAVDGLKSANLSVSRVRGAVKYVRQSPSRLQTFKTCIEIEKIQSKSGLCLDVSTRWNSTYLMLDAAQKFQRAFDRFEERDLLYKSELDSEDGVPNHDDWVNVRRLCTFLQCFYNLTIHVSGSLYVTCNNFFHEIYMMFSLLKMWAASDDVAVSSMAENMQKKYNKYWENPREGKAKEKERMNMLIYVAVVLDPRFKMVYVDVTFKDIFATEKSISMVNKVKESVMALFNEYKAMYQVQTGQTTGVAQASHELVNDEVRSMNPRFRFKKLRASSGVEDNITELDSYLSEKLEADIEGFDILNYWRVNSSRFPILSRLARDVLTVPISTVASESAFSTGGRVLDCFRSSLTPKIVQSLICTEDWLRASATSSKINIEEDLDDLERLEAELSGVLHESTILEI